MWCFFFCFFPSADRFRSKSSANIWWRLGCHKIRHLGCWQPKCFPNKRWCRVCRRASSSLFLFAFSRWEWTRRCYTRLQYWNPPSCCMGEWQQNTEEGLSSELTLLIWISKHDIKQWLKGNYSLCQWKVNSIFQGLSMGFCKKGDFSGNRSTICEEKMTERAAKKQTSEVGKAQGTTWRCANIDCLEPGFLLHPIH